MSHTQILINRILSLANKTKTEAARECGVSFKTMSNWCNGHSSASLDSVMRMCDIYYIQVDVFIHRF